MSFDLLLIAKHGPIDHDHSFHCLAYLGIQLRVLSLDLVKDVVQLTLDFFVDVEIFSDFFEVMLIAEVGHEHVVLYVCHQIVDKLKVLNVLLSKEFAAKTVSYPVDIFLDKRNLTLREMIPLDYLIDPNSVSGTMRKNAAGGRLLAVDGHHVDWAVLIRRFSDSNVMGHIIFRIAVVGMTVCHPLDGFSLGIDHI
jgi:hypothetical protein